MTTILFTASVVLLAAVSIRSIRRTTRDIHNIQKDLWDKGFRPTTKFRSPNVSGSGVGAPSACTLWEAPPVCDTCGNDTWDGSTVPDTCNQCGAAK